MKKKDRKIYDKYACELATILLEESSKTNSVAGVKRIIHKTDWYCCLFNAIDGELLSEPPAFLAVKAALARIWKGVDIISKMCFIHHKRQV